MYIMKSFRNLQGSLEGEKPRKNFCDNSRVSLRFYKKRFPTPAKLDYKNFVKQLPGKIQSYLFAKADTIHR